MGGGGGWRGKMYNRRGWVGGGGVARSDSLRLRRGHFVGPQTPSLHLLSNLFANVCSSPSPRLITMTPERPLIQRLRQCKPACTRLSWPLPNLPHRQLQALDVSTALPTAPHSSITENWQLWMYPQHSLQHEHPPLLTGSSGCINCTPYSTKLLHH